MINNPIPIGDMKQKEHENDANSHRVVLIGKTSGGVYKEIQVDNDGKVQIA
jgi:hypothetical protein